MRRSRRDPKHSAADVEEYAERVNTDDAWLVAADAWEDAGDLVRARFAFLRQPGLRFSSTTNVWAPSLVIRNVEAASIRRRYDAWNSAVSIIRAAERSDRRGAPIRHNIERPSDADLSRLEVYDFLHDPPTKLVAYYGPGGAVRTFTGDLLGTIASRGKTTRAFNRMDGPRLQRVAVRAINGYVYNGTCNLDTGTYCKLRRGKPWLRR